MATNHVITKAQNPGNKSARCHQVSSSQYVCRGERFRKSRQPYLLIPRIWTKESVRTVIAKDPNTKTVQTNISRGTAKS